MRFYFHEHAETEFDRTVEYYEDCRHGLGKSLPKKSTQQLTALFNALMRGRQCPRIPVAALSTGSHLASFIKSSLASRVSLQLPTFDVAQATGWTGSEQNKQVEQTAILLRLKQFKLSLSS